MTTGTLLDPGDACREHFTLKQDAMVDCCSNWAAECSSSGLQEQMKSALADIKKGLRAMSKGKGPSEPSSSQPASRTLIPLPIH